MDSAPVKLSREQLYEEVWKTPMHRLCAKYGLSDVGLAKVCRRMDIPRPPRGYWRRLSTGAKTRKPSLPPPGDFTQLEVTLNGRDKIPEKIVVNRETKIPARSPLVDEALNDPHPLVALTRDRFENASEDSSGVLITKAKRVLGLRVSRPQLDRCLRLMDTLFKSWEAEGLSIEILSEGDGTQHGTFLRSGNERLQIAIQERVEEYDPGPTDEEKLHPKWEWKKRTASRATSELTLFLDGEHVTSYTRFYRRFKDSPSLPLESKAQQIWQAGVDYFEKRKMHEIEQAKRRAAAEEERLQRELEWAREQAEWKREEEREKKRQEEQRKIKELAEAASQWSRSEQVRNFIPRCAASMKDARVPEAKIASWVAWAHAAADQIDPLKRGYPKIGLKKEEE
jgi:hypothetical protein